MNAADFVEPEYIRKMRQSPKYAHKSRLQIELILAAFYGVERLTGLTQHQHRENAMALLFPSRVPHPWRSRLLHSYYRARLEKRKELMLLGSSNSTKTSTLADLIIELWLECPEATSVYLCSPYEDATETGLWARVLEQFQEAKEANPELPGEVILSENKIILSRSNPLSFIRVVTVDKVGKLVGKKAKIFNVGLMLIVADELPEFKDAAARALLKVTNNLISVPNYLLIGAGNFATPNDALGKFAEPDLPGGYHDLRVHRDYEWTSRRRGLVIRFDGDQSPGLSDPEKYFFLPGAEYREQLALQSGGRTSADYYRYWHSFPLLLTEEYCVTSLTKIRDSGALKPYEWTSDTIVKGSHCDPGFGGDPAIVQCWRMGYVRTEDGSKVQVYEAWGEPITIPIDVTGDLEETAEAQVVRFHRKVAEDKNIPPENCSFDGSMRASIVQEYAKLWTINVTAIDSGGPATTRPVSIIQEVGPDGKERESATWRQKVSNFVTEMWMGAASLFISGQIRGISAEDSPIVQQLCKRQWKWEGKGKKKLETKLEFKANNSGKSPNEADAFIGGIEMARRRGLQLIGLTSRVGGSIALLRSFREERERKKLRHAIANTKEPLPTGRLHGRSRQSNPILTSGRLRRNR